VHELTSGNAAVREELFLFEAPNDQLNNAECNHVKGPKVTCIHSVSDFRDFFNIIRVTGPILPGDTMCRLKLHFNFDWLVIKNRSAAALNSLPSIFEMER
jgi:hypothetical protein